MKTIYLIRHAEASSTKANESDFQRQLNQHGRKEASLIGKKLKEMNANFDFIICSSATRTKETSKILSQEMSYSNIILFEEKIYEAPLSNLIQAVNQLPNQFNNVAVIAHNPSISYLANYLTDIYIANMPTCGVVKIELEINNWNEVIEGIGLQKFFIYPKMF
ncbi:MAG: histidine phosphatase family protein [Flavobacteriales bacterium]|jgi:phosphohistidine phosphatase|nr:histidine phosphatase family protein [Flavobacteriales bacterium]MCB9365194.1 histidine phosphatase family protein [Flavobacteriales bacterium]